MTRREWWNSSWLIPLAMVAIAVPLLWPRVPPLTDVPGHMASFYVSVASAHSALLRRFFTFHWQLVGNLGVDLAMVPLATLLGVERATKLMVIAIPMLTALGLLIVARQAHRRLPATALAALPIAYNYPFMLGFLDYCLSAALALLAFALWLRWPANRRPALRAASFAGIAMAVWLAHAIGWVMLGAMCGATELHRRWTAAPSVAAPAVRRLTPALIGTAVTCLCLIAPIILIGLGPHADHTSSNGWFSLYDYVKATGTILRDRWPLWDILSLAVPLVLVGAALFRVGGLRLVPSVAWPAAALFVLFLVAPGGLNGSAFVNTRIVPYALALAVVAIDTSRLALSRRAALAAGAALFCGARLVGNTISFGLYDASYTRELAALDHIPRGATVVTLVQMPCHKRWNEWHEHRLEHIAGLATVRRDAFVNVLWSITGLHLLQSALPQAVPFGNDPSEFVSGGSCYVSAREAFSTVPSGVFTHLWLIGVPPVNRPIDPRLVPVWASGNSILYRIAKTPRS